MGINFVCGGGYGLCADEDFQYISRNDDITVVLFESLLSFFQNDYRAHSITKFM